MRHVMIIQTFLAYVHNVPKYFKNYKKNSQIKMFLRDFLASRAPFINEAILIRGHQGTSKPHIT